MERSAAPKQMAQAPAPERWARADAPATPSQVGVGKMKARAAPPRAEIIEREAGLDFAEEPAERGRRARAPPR